MSIPLLKFPYLALDNILKQMHLKNVYDLAELSKNTFKLVRRSYLNVKLEFYFEWNSALTVSMPHSENNFFEIKLYDFCDLEDSIKKSENRIEAFALDKRLTFNSTLDYLANLFPSLDYKIRVDELDHWTPPDAEDFTEKMRQFQELDFSMDNISVKSDEKKADNELVIAALRESHVFRFLQLKVATTAGFKLEKCPKVACESIAIVNSQWVTKDNFIDAFMECENVELDNTCFNNEEVREIMEKWVQGSSLEQLIFLFDSSTLSEVFANCVGAYPVVEAYISIDQETERRLFRRGQCYSIVQKSGRKAVVFVWNGKFHLSTGLLQWEDYNVLEILGEHDRDGADFEDNENDME